MSANARTIYIVDDNAEFRRSAQWWLASAGYEVVDYADPADALGALQAHPPAQPACLLLDMRMPGMSGLDLHDRLLEAGVHLPIVYMTGHGDVPLAVQAMQRGAISFLEKPFAEDALEAALQRAFAPAPTAASEPADDAPAGEWRQRLARLTPRERELLGWVVEDKLNKTIADLMGISIKTVELHRKRVMEKLGAASATHLIKMVVSERVV
jgi:two-component system, LuxR family, response regulator FixJ